MKFFLPTAFLFVTVFGLCQSKTVISDIDDYEDAINAAGAGDTLVLTNGVHDGNSMTITTHGEEDNPLVIMAETIGGAELTGDSKFIFDNTHHVVIHGFKFTNENGTAIKFEGCNNMRITRNTFDLNEDSSTKWIFIGGIWDMPEVLSHHNRIDHNTFQNKSEAGHYITVDGSDGLYQSQFDLIDHNYFKDNTPRFSNEKESIRIGWSEMSESSGYTIVEFNLFENCNGDPEIISVKSCDNVVRHNTIRESDGTISLRHGNRNRVEGNYFFGNRECTTSDLGTHCTGGIRIYGEDHVIVNNYLEGLKGNTWDAPIALTNGDADAGSSSLSKHFRIERAIIAYNMLVDNEHGIEIGFDNNDKYSKPPRDVVIANNLITGSENELIKFFNDPDNMTWSGNVMDPSGSAVLTSSSETFGSDEIQIANPNLTYDADFGAWRATSTTPQAATNVGLTGSIDNDIDGQPRSNPSGVGADHFSSETIRYLPLTPEDVGPHSYHPDYDGESALNHLIASVSILNFENGAGSQLIEITSNVDWSIQVSDDWISTDISSGSGSETIEITVDANDVPEMRFGTITLSGESLSASVVVSQNPMDLGGDQLEVVAVTASGEQNEPGKVNVKENAIDGDLETRWSAEGEQYIQFELAQSFNVEYVKIAFYKGDERQTHYQLDVSEDGVSFANVVTQTLSSGETSGFETIDFDDVSAQYIRLTGFGNTGGSDWNSISEVEIYGSEDEQIALSVSSENRHLYPNPANDVIFAKGQGTSHYQILDLSGRKLKSGLIKDGWVDVRRLKPGVYILELTDQKFKFVKN